jgi:Uma2 family endonuclease
MATQIKVPLDEYLRTSYEPDREFLDGEILERTVGGYPHSWVQRRLLLELERLSGVSPLHTCPELRVRVAENRYRVIDLAVYREGEPAERFPSAPPFIAIEILSPTDPAADILQKLEEYAAWGVAHIWLIDPESRRLFVYDQSALKGVNRFELSELRVEIPAASIF